MNSDNKAKAERVLEQIKRHGAESLCVVFVMSLNFEHPAARYTMKKFYDYMDEVGAPDVLALPSEAMPPSEMRLVEEKSGVFLLLMGSAAYASLDNYMRASDAELN